MPRIKILIFYQYFCTPEGSWSTRIYELGRRWVAAGHQVTVVSAPYEKSDVVARGFISTQHFAGIDVIVINIRDSNRFSFLRRAFNAACFTMIASVIALFSKYDLALASSGPLSIGLPMIVAKKLRGKTAVFEVRDLWPAGAISLGKIKAVWQQKLAGWFERKCYESANVVVTASPDQQSNIRSRYPQLKTAVIANGADIELFGQKSTGSLPDWTQGKVLFTHVGSLGFIHNVKYWLSVAQAVQERDPDGRILFVMIGEGAERATLQEIAENENIMNIRFPGLLPKVQLPLWVQASRATLVATLDDPVQNTCSPNKLFDSFAAGTPVVQTTTGWIKTMIMENECGINVPLDDPGVATDKLIFLAQHPEEALRLGRNAQRLAETEFDRDKLAQRYLDIMESVVKSSDNVFLNEKPGNTSE